MAQQHPQDPKNETTRLFSFFDFPIEQFADRSVRWLLEDRENVRGLLEILDADLVAPLDFSRLQHINRSFIPDNLREQESDLIYSVPFRSDADTTDELLIYILIEHQSTVDPIMGFRLLFYMTQLWDFQRRTWEADNTPRSEWRFRPIIPILFYTGDRKWQTPLALSTLMTLPDTLSPFVPTFETLFLDVKAVDPASLTRTDHPLGWLLTVLQKEHADAVELRDALQEAVVHINSLSDERIAEWRRAIFYLYLVIYHRRPSEEHEPLKTLVHQSTQETDRRQEGTEMAQTMAQYLVQQGEKRGETQAKRDAILKLLHLRFDAVPETVTQRVKAIRSTERLDTLFERAATAQNLNDIDWGNTRQ